MENNVKNIVTRAKKVALSKEDKDRTRQAIFSYVETYPLRDTQTNRPFSQRERNQSAFSFFINSINSKFVHSMPIAIIIALVISGGVVAGAEGSLPGDVLYPVKISVNEELRAVLTFSAEGDARWEAERAIRRLEEAEKLEAKGELNAETKVKLEARFNEHSEKAEKLVVKLKSENDAEAAANVSSEFEAKLKAHAVVITSVGAAGNAENRSDKAVMMVVPATLEDGKIIINIAPVMERVAELRAESESEVKAKVEVEKKVEAKAAVEGKIKAAGNKIEAVKRQIVERREKVSAEVVAKAEAHLNVALEAFAVARAQLEAKSYSDAFVKAQEAIRRAEEAQALLNVLDLGL